MKSSIKALIVMGGVLSALSSFGMQEQKEPDQKFVVTKNGSVVSLFGDELCGNNHKCNVKKFSDSFKSMEEDMENKEALRDNINGGKKYADCYGSFLQNIEMVLNVKGNAFPDELKHKNIFIWNGVFNVASGIKATETQKALKKVFNVDKRSHENIAIDLLIRKGMLKVDEEFEKLKREREEQARLEEERKAAKVQAQTQKPAPRGAKYK